MMEESIDTSMVTALAGYHYQAVNICVVHLATSSRTRSVGPVFVTFWEGRFEI
jgi:hypothetical protein